MNKRNNNEADVTIALHFQEGNSDKVYNVHMYRSAPAKRGEDALWNVRVEWARRGFDLKMMMKAVNVSTWEARRTFDDIVRDKMRKGYKEVRGEKLPANSPYNNLPQPITPSKFAKNAPVIPEVSYAIPRRKIVLE